MNDQYIELPETALAAGPVAISCAGREIGIFRINDAVYAIDNRCPHAHAALSNGHIFGDVVECAFHNARFHLPSGKCLHGPGRDIRTYPVTRIGGRLLIDCRPKKDRELQRSDRSEVG